MKMKYVLAAAIALSTCAGYSQDLFQATFKAKCKVVSTGGAVTTTTMSDKDLIDQCVGAGGTNGPARGFVLVYNATSNSLQVVTKTNGAVSCDVFDFQTSGTPLSDTKESDQLAFVFLPGGGDSIGSAIITQKTGKALTGGASDRVNVSGTLQFQMTDGSGNTEICTGTFMAGKRIVVTP